MNYLLFFLLDFWMVCYYFYWMGWFCFEKNSESRKSFNPIYPIQLSLPGDAVGEITSPRLPTNITN